MADNYSGLNVSTGIGDGDANVMHWNAFDKASDRLYAEQMKRKQLAEQNYQQQQAMFQKELGQIRSVDVPEVVDLYNKRKAITQQLLFDKKLQKDPVAFANAQLAAKQAEAAYYGLVQGSKETMGFDKNLSEDMSKNHDLYADDAHDKLSQAAQIPTSKRMALGMNNTTPYLYQGTNTDFGALDKLARGEVRDIAGKEYKTEDGFQYATPTFKAGNTPSQYKDILLDQFAKRQAGRDAAKLLNQIPMQQYEEINKAYNAIPETEWAKWGVEKQDLEPRNKNNAAEVFASLKAKEYALSNLPKPGETKYRLNQGAILGERQKNAKELEYIRQAGRMKYLNAQQAFKQKSKEEQQSFLDNIIKGQYDRAKTGGSYEYKTKDGKKYSENEIKASPLTKKAFAVQDENGKLVYPDRIRIQSNGDIRPVFFKRDKDGNQIIVNGKAAVNEARSQPVSKDEYKIQLGNILLSGKSLDRELSDSFGDEIFDDGGGEDIEFSESISVPVNAKPVTDPELLKTLNNK